MAVSIKEKEFLLKDYQRYTKTELEYAIDIKNVLDIYHIHREQLDGGIISSVVPKITKTAKLAVEKILDKEVLVVGAGI